MRVWLPLILLSSAPAALAADPKISEVRLDSLAPFTNIEYLELTGVAGTSLDGLAIVVIGDAGSEDSATCGDSGVVEGVTSLDGAVIPADRVFLTHSSPLLLVEPDFTAELHLEDADNLTVLLVRGSTAFAGQDLDTNNDGLLDATPWKSVVDGVALVWRTPGVGSEHIYDPHTVVTTNGQVLFGARRCLDNNAWTPLAAIYPGELETPGSLSPYCGGVLCLGDITLDLEVGSADLAVVLSNWGEIGTRGDVNLDGLVDAFDLTSILTHWGPCEE